jgi:hypothetical protein
MTLERDWRITVDGDRYQFPARTNKPCACGNKDERHHPLRPFLSNFSPHSFTQLRSDDGVISSLKHWRAVSEKASFRRITVDGDRYQFPARTNKPCACGHKDEQHHPLRPFLSNFSPHSFTQLRSDDGVISSLKDWRAVSEKASFGQSLFRKANAAITNKPLRQSKAPQPHGAIHPPLLLKAPRCSCHRWFKELARGL